MDRFIQWIKQYRYVALILLIGMGLMLLPEGKEEEAAPDIRETEPSEGSVEEKLAKILSRMEGAGNVEVLLTIGTGAETIYECDEDRSTGESGGTERREVVVITDDARNEQGLVQQVNPPTYQGAVILCQGADSPAVRLSIVEAVCDATGLTADRITVLKMK